MSAVQVIERPHPGANGGLRPSSSGVVFSPRPLLSTGRNVRSLRNSTTSLARSFHVPSTSSGSTTVMLAANPKLTSIEVEAIIKQKLWENMEPLKQAFQLYDADRCTNVTKGEFRRVLENYCLPMTAEQFNALVVKIGTNPNGTISYLRFIDKFVTNSLTPNIGVARILSRPSSSNKQRIDTIERFLQQKIAANLKNVIRSFKLFDYNMDGLVQRHELRRVIENYCLKLNDSQFNKLWSRYDFQHTGAINYRDFLRRLGVNAATAERHVTTPLNNGPDEERDDEDGGCGERVSEEGWEGWVVKGYNIPLVIKLLTYIQDMKNNYQNIKRALMTFDISSDGFISIDDLKAVLDNFVLPTSDEIFHQLMYKFEVRGTGKVSWEQFLSKFQDPQSNGNGQTIPIGQNHKVNPTRQALDNSSTPDVIKKLKDHILNNFATLKQAFLAFDENRKGVIGRKDLRRIIETFAMKISDENFKELQVYLDPQHTGFINYHSFLQLFESREHVTAHKWLFSTHKFNENQSPAILAWNTVEEILREKLSENYRMVDKVADEYSALDTTGDGRISRTHLRRLINRYALPVSDEHFNKMWSACEGSSEGRICFARFLDNLNIDVQPGDLEGTSKRIQEESSEREERINEIDKADLRHTNLLSASEVVRRLKDRMLQHDAGIRKSFLRFSRSGKDRVTKKDLRKMLDDIGLRMEDSQFKELMKMLHVNGRGLLYSDFVESFQDPRTDGMGKVRRQELERAGNHIVNPTNVRYMTAQECYDQLLERMRQNFGSVRSAFYKVDDDHDGNLTMTEFRRLFDSFMFIITDQTFHELLRMLGLTKRSSLSYHDFLNKEEGHPWLKSEHRYNRPRSATELAADQVHQCLCLKAEQAWSDLAKAFQNFDADGNGIIKKKELRSVLFRFILPISHAEFNKLWSRYDEEGKGFISHQDFTRKLGVGFTTGDNLVLKEMSKNKMGFFQPQKMFCQIKKKLNIPSSHRDRFREYYSDFDKAFRQLDKNRDGYITIADLQRVLLQLNYFLDEKQFLDLLRRLGLPTTKSKLSYFDFLRSIDDGRASKYGRRDVIGRESVTWQSFESLTVEKATIKLKEQVTVNYDSLNAAFRAFDRLQTGLVKVVDFRRLLDNFCFKLTDKQFRGVLLKCRITGGSVSSNKMINWIVFLQDFSQIKDVKLKEWGDYVGKIAPPQSPHELPLVEVEERISEVVTARHFQISRDFADVDYAKIFVVSREDFRDILNRHVMRLTDDQFNRLWAKQAVNEFNNIEYREFLKRYQLHKDDKVKQEGQTTQKPCDEIQPISNQISVPRPPSRLGTSDSHRLRGNPRPVTPLVNADSAEMKVKDLVYKSWQDIQRECKKLDLEGTGTVLPDEFVGILDSFGVMLPLEDARQLMLKYDLHEQQGRFSYREFLRHFILTLKPQDEGLLKRRKIHAA
uniref:EF-hand domain-containing protein n=1 Tax=Ciona intestinalis TaxID=7719 RepID=F6TMY0_CIOIN